MRGKEFKIENDFPLKFSYGSIDYKTPKLIFFNIRGWFKMDDITTFKKDITFLEKGLKKLFKNNNSVRLFKEDIICDFQFKTSNLKVGKYSFLKCEISFKQNKNLLELESDLINEYFKQLTEIVTQHLSNNKNLSFKKSKKYNLHKV